MLENGLTQSFDAELSFQLDVSEPEHAFYIMTHVADLMKILYPNNVSDISMGTRKLHEDVTLVG